MEQIRLGESGVQVSRIGLGCMSMSGAYGPSDDAAAIDVVHRALDLGVSLLDSSDMYGWGHNETLLGQALRGRRVQAVVTTKFGQVRNPDGGRNLVSGRPEYVRQACEASLKRLGVEVIDLYYQHRVDPDVPIEETVGAMSRLVTEGKVRALGLSEAASSTIRRAHLTYPIAAVQTEYSLLYRSPGEETLAVCRELGIAFVPYSPLGRGLLAGAVHAPSDLPAGDRRRQHPRFAEPHLEQNLALIRAFTAVAARKGVTPAQLALAWVLAQGPHVIPIPGTKRASTLEENLGALEVSLTSDDLAAVAEAVPPGATAGARYPEAQLRGLQL
jgi:aryl-alcohol dehydrogenase-like predicted oxidoreductase